ncbi:cysteine-rich PDZ-binding protein isoform X2 [Sagmatias obliquidens]|uniref:Cysteine-rich PDZ-binding protein n=1 Tax=Tursiops truncatus TaxID=9739 RepID=A0A6J3PWY2_TURTR|nr:cysteine-rich PDZ-binding protein isoform X2 [Lagenorhynchus obliquidens]XP_033694487.1 cysteine-rich PDZ-binding protein isoform X2 [Tursiops truncatus]
MVCEKCEKKLGTVITPDTWKDGARNTTESGGRKLNENKALTSKKARVLCDLAPPASLTSYCANSCIRYAKPTPIGRGLCLLLPLPRMHR